MNNYDWLVGRLDAFIRKYYANKVIRGALVLLSCLLFYIVTVSVGEYYLYLPVWSRIAILSAFVGLGLTALVAWVILPLAKMANLGSIISHEQAAAIIGKHFPEVSDKLLNILQLRNKIDNSSRELAEASINQKIGQISVVPITSAIDLSKNRKYIPYVLPPLLAGIFILIAAPNVFKEGSSRLLQPTTAFEKPAPFKFIIKNTSLVAIRNSDFTIAMETDGAALPAEASIEIGGERVGMQSLPGHSFQYVFRNVTEGFSFCFYAAGFNSQPYTVKVIQRPVLKSFSVAIAYPPYTGRKNETRNSLGDMTLPAGTTVSWRLATAHTDAATIHFGSGRPLALNGSAAEYDYRFRFLNDTAYTITLHNNKAAVADSYQYQVQVIPDQYPVLQVQQFKDSVSGKQILLSGTAGDDYSITRVTFNYEVSDKDKKTILNKRVPVKAAQGALASFEQYFDIQSLDLKPGQKVTYFIEAWDNDGIHGSKASRSEVMSYQMYDAEQLDSAINENSKQINSGISNSAERTKKLQNDYKDAENKMLQSSNMDWQMQQTIQEMMEKQQELKTQVENVKQRFEEQMQQAEQKNYSEDLKEKQKELNKQLNNLLNEELKKQMEKLQELMQKLNKEQALETMKQLEEENKLFNMDMERMQELMKKMELQMRMEDLANKMDKLATDQRKLQKETEQSKKDAAALNKEQKNLEGQLEKALKEDMKEVQKLAKETKEKDRLENEEQQGKDAQQDMKDSEDAIDKKENGKAGKSQDKAAENLENMAKSMREKAAGMDAEQIDIDIRATRQILSNLIRLSFSQEDLMEKVRHTSTSMQAYVENQEEQNRLHRNSQMIRDSLFSLSKRIVKLAPTINKTTTDLEHRMQKAVSNLEGRRPDLAATDQQYVMTLTNNLALILNELLANLMQMQAEGKKPGAAGMCKKPGGKKPGQGGGQLSDIISEQQQLGEGMKKMQKPGGKDPGGQDGKKPGQKPGGQKPGQGQNGTGGSGAGEGQEGDNEYGNSEQLAKLAQQQAAIRRQLSELASQLSSKGLGNFSKELRELEQKMDKNETDLVNRRISPDMMLRQKEITTRLLETEKSLREQEQDDKRSSRTAEETSRPVPPALQKYITDKKQMLEQYKTVPPQLKPYYRDMVENYFRIIGNP